LTPLAHQLVLELVFGGGAVLLVDLVPRTEVLPSLWPVVNSCGTEASWRILNVESITGQ